MTIDAAIEAPLQEQWLDDDWQGLLYAIKYKTCTPVLGAGACAGVLPLDDGIEEELQAFKFVSQVRNELRAEAMIPIPGCGWSLVTGHIDVRQRPGRQHNAARTYTQGRRRT